MTPSREKTLSIDSAQQRSFDAHRDCPPMPHEYQHVIVLGQRVDLRRPNRGFVGAGFNLWEPRYQLKPRLSRRPSLDVDDRSRKLTIGGTGGDPSGLASLSVSQLKLAVHPRNILSSRAMPSQPATVNRGGL